DHRSAGGGAVALPQLPAVGPVFGAEEEGPVDVRQLGRGGAGRAGLNVADQRGAGGGAGTLEEFAAGGPVIGAEEQRAADGGEGCRGGVAGGVEVRDGGGLRERRRQRPEDGEVAPLVLRP